MERKNIIKARAIIPIFYSTVTNTSKKISYMLQDKLQSQNFLSTITNIGDINKEQFLQITGPIIMLMSTYGNGGSPADGDDFIDWLKQLQKKNYFQQFQLSILGLGNRSFQHFCGNSKTIRQLMIHNGAKQIIQLTTCNSSSPEQSAMEKFPAWSDELISKLKQKYQLKEINVQQLLQKFKIITSNENIGQQDWQKQYQKWQPRLGKQFLTYHKSHTADVIHIKQLRQKNDGRSTLWIRLKCPEGFKIQPACNISIYPENVRKQGQKPLEGVIKIQTKKANTKVPYPPMPLQSLWKISNFNQFADLNLIKYALTLSEKPEQIKAKYQRFLKSPQQLENNPIRCYQLYDDLNPGLDFVVKLGVNSVRAYTLASWTAQKQYFDLVVSIDPLGLASKYFQSRPMKMKILPTSSTFYVPSGRPIVMIANGSGIAPFRSLTQQFLLQKQIPKLYLYYGIQNKNIDFYFKQQWETLQKQGKIKLRIAESRTNPDKKVYVQQLLKQDKEFLCKHLFEQKGVIFICGSAAMSKSVDTEIFQAIKKHQPIPFKAFKLHTQLMKNKTIVKQVFD